MSRSRQQRSRAAAPAAAVAASGQHGATAAAPAAAPVPPAAAQADATDTTTTDRLAELPVPIGVGIDTSRYGHYACFLRGDLQPAAADLKFVESAAGYQQLRERLDAIARKHAGAGPVHFHFRLDVAGRYADNLLAFLHSLPHQSTISCGDPERNKNYRAAIFGGKKSDPVEAAACARYALTERPKPTPALGPELRLLCQIASRLESQTRQNTRVVNQLHNLLGRTFPELALLVSDVSAGWVLALLDRYPSAAKLAKARAGALEKIPYLPHEHIATLLAQAKDSVASLTGAAAEELVRDLVRQVKEARIRHKSLEKLLVNAYRRLPANHLDSIIGIGPVTAAILTAKIVDPRRFRAAGKLVGHFGVYPVEASSGIDRDGKARLPIRLVMSKRGNDLVRRYLWMAALSACQHNPAVRPLYQRVRAKHPERPAIAVGHAMRKLLHLVLAVWHSGKPFDPDHYPWDRPAHLEQPPQQSGQGPEQSAAEGGLSEGLSVSAQAAGHKNPDMPGWSVVTAACASATVAQRPAARNAPVAAASAPLSDTPASRTRRGHGARSWIDFEHVKSQLPLERVLEHLGVLATLRGSAQQRRGPCPLHTTERRSGGRRRGCTFSVHLGENIFQCFDKQCGRKGDVIDLWAALKGVKLRDAALELVTLFNLEAAPGTEKRNG